MSSFLLYLLKVNVVFALLSTTYYFLLKGLTFHYINRLFLLLIIPVSLALPCLDFTIYNNEEPIIGELLSSLPEDVRYAELGTVLYESEVFSFGWLWWLYSLGMVIGFAILVWNAGQLLNLVNKADKTYQQGYAVYQTEAGAVFSCFNWVFLPKSYKPESIEKILAHEIAHIRLGHTYDLLLTQLFIVINWFNPLVYLYRQMLKSVHEYQADAYVLQSTKKSDYLTLMLQTITGESLINFASSFTASTLKNRINMITKKQNTILHTSRYFTILPVLLLLIFAFAEIASTPPSILPVKKGDYSKIAAEFSVSRKDAETDKLKKHGGIDIVANTGTAVMAAGSGKVVKAESSGDWGNLVVIDHGDGYQSWYAHLNKISVAKDAQVTTGQQIGEVGSTGAAVNAHLHYEVRKNGKRLNPKNYFQK